MDLLINRTIANIKKQHGIFRYKTKKDPMAVRNGKRPMALEPARKLVRFEPYIKTILSKNILALPCFFSKIR